MTQNNSSVETSGNSDLPEQGNGKQMFDVEREIFETKNGIKQEMNAQQALSENTFESYKMTDLDLHNLHAAISTVESSSLIEAETLENLRFVTFDSNFLYVVTKGNHATSSDFEVEEIQTVDDAFHTYKIRHSGFIGKKLIDYAVARSWLLCDEIEMTAINAKKYPNENTLYQPSVSQPDSILDVIQLPPVGPFDRIHHGEYAFLPDVAFHEAGHIEMRRLLDWHEGQAIAKAIPSQSQRTEFETVINSSKMIPDFLKAIILKSDIENALQELYPMIIDNEASERYVSDNFKRRSDECMRIIASIKEDDTSFIQEFVSDSHIFGRLLSLIFREAFPDFPHRKETLRSIMSPKSSAIIS